MIVLVAQVLLHFQSNQRPLSGCIACSLQIFLVQMEWLDLNFTINSTETVVAIVAVDIARHFSCVDCQPNRISTDFNFDSVVVVTACMVDTCYGQHLAH